MKAERSGQTIAPALRGERLLVVDDDPDVRVSLERALRCAGYAVTTAVHGADALDALARAPVDLIVLDVLMPMVDGFDACRRLRAAETPPPSWCLPPGTPWTTGWPGSPPGPTTTWSSR